MTTPRATSSRSPVNVWLVAAGALAAALAILMPDHWYQPLPPPRSVPPAPISGWLLLRICLLLDAALLVWLGTRRGRLVRLTTTERIAVAAPPGLRAPAWSCWTLAGITAGALALRLVSIGSDLWLDELTPLLRYEHATAWQIVTNYVSSNNHLLNTLLVKWSVATVGEHEWSVRLPAVLFGTATVPVMFWITRVMGGTVGRALAGALLLAVSYHHVFFSQNARGYAAYMFFALVSSGLLARALSEDRARVWVAYAAAMTGALSVILISGFLLAAHVAVGVTALVLVRRRGGAVAPLAKRLLAVFGATAFVGLQIYVVALPSAIMYMNYVYTDPASGYGALSMEFVREVVRGLSAGFAPWFVVAAIPAAIAGAAGYLALLRRHWPVTLALSLPLAFKAVFLVVLGLVVSPRFFILALPLAMLTVVETAWLLGRLLHERLSLPAPAARAAVTIGLLTVAVASAAALPAYYHTPKQSYRAPLRYLDSVRSPDDLVLVVHYAEAGFKYYARRLRMDTTHFRDVRTTEALDAALAEFPGARVWLLSTFPRALNVDRPDLERRLQAGWIVDRRFPGTIGDGQTMVWRAR